jgi:hypothetical protein
LPGRTSAKTGARKGRKKMQADRQDAAKKFIDSMRSFDRCEWCGRDGKRNRNGLCRHCNDVRKDLEKFEKEVLEVGAELEPHGRLVWLNRELAIAGARKKSCIAWGRMLDDILAGHVEPLTLESNWFRPVQKRIANDDKSNHGREVALGSIFTPDQRQVLAYMFWEILGEEASHNRRKRAEGIIDPDNWMQADEQAPRGPA